MQAIDVYIGAANIDLMKQALCDVDWESILDTLNTNDAWIYTI